MSTTTQDVLLSDDHKVTSFSKSFGSGSKTTTHKVVYMEDYIKLKKAAQSDRTKLLDLIRQGATVVEKHKMDIKRSLINKVGSIDDARIATFNLRDIEAYLAAVNEQLPNL